jgi:hypothetical protein
MCSRRRAVPRRTVAASTRRVLSVALACQLASGCGTSALIDTKEGGHIDARIVGGSPGSIYLAGDNHDRFTLRRDDIADVDHPGDVLIIIGTALTAIGGFRLWQGDSRCNDLGANGDRYCILNATPAMAGLLSLAWGLWAYHRSTKAFADRSRPEPDAAIAPRGLRVPVPALPYPAANKRDPFADPAP